MKNLFLVSLLFYGLTSCGDTTDDKSTTNDMGSVSSVTDDVQEPTKDIDTLSEMPAEISGRVNKTINFPYLLNQEAIDDLEFLSHNGLSQEEVELLSQYLIVHPGFSDIESRLDSYFRFNQLIDSIGVEAYNDQIDLGMTQYFNAHLHYRVNLTEIKYLLIWSLDYGTYEACPYYEGQYFLATMCVDGKISNTVFIGEDSGGGDPPYMSSIFAGSDVWDTYIEVKLFEEYTEESEMSGEDEYEMETHTKTNKSKCRFLITEKNIILDK
jgi:hypothetical protein